MVCLIAIVESPHNHIFIFFGGIAAVKNAQTKSPNIIFFMILFCG
jgi:hypothetical protein